MTAITSRPVVHRLLARLVAIGVVTLFLAAGVTAMVAWREAAGRLQEQAEQIEQSLGVGLGQTVWEVDLPQTEAQLRSALAVSSVARVEFHTFTGQHFRFVNSSRHGEFLVRSVAIRHGDQSLGGLEIAMAKDALIDAVVSHMIQVLILVSAFIALFGGLFYRVVSAQVTGPLRSIAAQVASLSRDVEATGGGLREDPGLAREFALLVRVFNELHGELQRRFRHEQSLLAESRELNQAVVAGSSVGVAVYESAGQCVLVNDAFARLVGAGRDQLLAQNFRDLPSWREFGLLEPALAALAGEEASDLERYLVSSFGRAMWMNVRFDRISMDGVPHLLLLGTDITERKLLELDLSRSNEELERFAYVASHDLREPLRMVSSFLGLLERRMRGRLDDEERSFIGFAVDGAKRMDRMIIDLLDYSRIGRGESEFEMVPLDVVINRALANLAQAIAEAGAEVVVAPALPLVPGHDSELERLFQNLISNAIKFHAQDKKPTIRVDCREEAREWVLSVADNGIGIAAADHARLFRVFRRLVSQEAYEGTGIGLATCRKIAEHHGGRIWLESEIGKGSTFLVALPKKLAV